ncbi:SH3-like domain-containing protein [Flavobacterium beibuense]|uniref:Nitrile hydratase beta subunit protein n=1 Tax=Flavobacterium beibuense TaxID=657326 RepID=A0A444WED0_9FLAO|nr:SH3-like domain-containing protein [Flavobacterium beibuense]RYJ44210.1 Nitrile hydratase beta subunit protein [Flavobacterium beibuense]
MKIVDHKPALFKEGEKAKIAEKFPIGHYRVPMYVRGKTVLIVKNLGRHINPELEAFGKNAGDEEWYYQVTIPQKELWPDYEGKDDDLLEIEVFEPWLDPINNAL